MDRERTIELFDIEKIEKHGDCIIVSRAPHGDD